MFRHALGISKHIALPDVCFQCASIARPIAQQRSLQITARRQLASIRGQALDRSYFGSRSPDVSNAFRHTRRRRRKDEEKPLPLDASSTLAQSASQAPARSIRRLISTYLALTKPRLAFLIVLTTTAAYSIYPVPAVLSSNVTAAPSLSTLTLAFLTTGTFLTIASANTLNMLFEPAHDAKMSRTRNRPLVRGLLSKRAAMVFAIATGVVGTGTLWLGVNPTTALLGAGNLILYAFIYTPFKRLHPVNTWVGAIVGAIPPLMGWCAAGSQYSTKAASPFDIGTVWEEAKDLLCTEQAIGGWLLAALLFAWQFPHFFALSYAVRQEYAGAGYKMLTSTNVPMAARVSFRYSLLMFPICFGLIVLQGDRACFRRHKQCHQCMDAERGMAILASQWRERKC
ncbi:hypothetical protein AMS68_003132 [Peltaster fructicola]|uniref:Protoheme IX farnesyltransferase, mitochondrial n=1 Tax=Peltaster fructicola TaxID=286661 RepID=A0A6H0XSJ9_9PEZI|nr:hypothetical protein AMS68_003132 [Peltaster fructicola]